MEFWKKAFLSLLILFIACFYLSIYVVASQSYRSSLDNERTRAYGESAFIKNSLEKDLTAILDRGGDSNEEVRSLFMSYAAHYYSQQIGLSFVQDGNVIYTSMPNGWSAQLSTVNDQLTSKVVKHDGLHYVTVCTMVIMPSREYTFMLARDMSGLVGQYAIQTRFLIILAFSSTVLLAIGLYFILRRLAKPIETLDEATERIAQGSYSMRVPVQGKDEFASLARHFNSMADEIEKRVGELVETAEQKQRFVDNLAHELRTPLTTIRGYAEYLRNANIGEEDRLSSLEHILSEAKRMQDMAFKLLDLSLMRHGNLLIEQIDVPCLFEELAASMHLRLDSKGITLAADCDCQCRVLNGDIVLIKCLLHNLLDNAVKASDAHSTISLVCTQSDDTTAIEIIDQGKGISPDHLQRIMEPFYRVDSARSRLDGGAGLGLALCKEIVELHQATMSISSSEGIGTTVKITFATP